MSSVKGHLLRNHSALLRKSKAATPASRAVLDRIKDYEKKEIITPAKAKQFRDTLNQRNYSSLYVQKIHKELDRLSADSAPINGRNSVSKTSSALDDGSLSLKTALSSKSSVASSKMNSSVQVLPSPSAMSDASIGKASSTATQQWHSILHKSGAATGHNRLAAAAQRSTASAVSLSRHITWEDQSVSTSGGRSSFIAPADSTSAASEKENKTDKTVSSVAMASSSSSNSNKSSILDPSEISDFHKPFNSEEIKQLFVEMCFFARLGFLQPPCCLNCTYRESIKKSAVVPNCPRWTIWRKDASMALHPMDVADNVVAIQCHAARKLLDGVTMEGYSWNAESSMLESVKDQ
mmetsp:Transcript_21812/g.47144  ORF Transcript_21812/g.47144 Transcript_21812/m.47144 type:complete len:350 (-) Transcript_21812:246-1295(-)